MPWFAASSSAPARHRQLDLPEQLARVAPDAVAASMTVGGTERMPASTRRMTGGDGVDDGGDDRGEPGRLRTGPAPGSGRRTRAASGRRRGWAAGRSGSDRSRAVRIPGCQPEDRASGPCRRGRWPASASRAPTARAGRSGRGRRRGDRRAPGARDTDQAMATTTAITSHHGAVVRTPSSGFRTTCVKPSLIAAVSPRSWS